MGLETKAQPLEIRETNTRSLSEHSSLNTTEREPVDIPRDISRRMVT